MTETLQKVLSTLISTSKDRDIDDTLEQNIKEALKLRDVLFDDVRNHPALAEISLGLSEDDGVRWRFVGVLGYALCEIVECIAADPDYMIGVSFQKAIKSSCEFLVCFGVLPSLIPGVGIPLEKRTESAHLYKAEEMSPTQKYDRLKAACGVFTRLCRVNCTKAIVYGNFMKDYLASLIQLSHAPLAKPGASKLYDKSEFTMSEELYARLQNDQAQYRKILDPILAKCYRPLLIKELLILQSLRDPSPPQFMKIVLSRELSNILVAKDGLLFTMRCFFDSPNIDVGNQWKHVDIIKRLVSVKHGSLPMQEYLKNICDQIKAIVHSQSNNDYTMVAAACLANLYEQYPNDDSVLSVIHSIVGPLMLTGSKDYTNGILILSSGEIGHSIKRLELCFVTPKFSLPVHFLTPIIYNLFGLRVFSDASTKAALNNLLIKHFSSKAIQNAQWFQTMVFKKPFKDIIVNENLHFEQVSDGIQIKYVEKKGNIAVESGVNCILEIIEKHIEAKSLAHAFYVFCLTSMMTFGGEAKTNISKDLLINEEETHDLISKESEYTLILLKALENLTSMESVFKSFKEDPSLIVEFVISFLNEYADCVKNKKEFKNEECIMICLTLATILVSEHTDNDVLEMSLKRIEEPVKCISEKSTREDIKFLSIELYTLLTQNTVGKKKEITEFELAVNDICDPLLPTRAHGIMQLTKLIEAKDSETLSKKHYVQCIFEENLKSDDSYLYLCAINGLAAMANYSQITEEVLEVLTREFSKEKTDLKTCDEESEIIKIRMKVGEVLVKVTKSLGDMAANHKALLLNTFLCGCRDKDELIRASSLSNLAEVARVLSYKLGPVLYEMLNCINSILETDKSQECRRASVLVISSLLKGLGREALYYLREALTPIYRTLKRLYSDEAEDATVRLHAQIALEELNSIVRGMIFSPPKMEKQIFVIDKPSL